MVALRLVACWLEHFPSSNFRSLSCSACPSNSEREARTLSGARCLPLVSGSLALRQVAVGEQEPEFTTFCRLSATKRLDHTIRRRANARALHAFELKSNAGCLESALHFPQAFRMRHRMPLFVPVHDCLSDACSLGQLRLAPVQPCPGGAKLSRGNSRGGVNQVYGLLVLTVLKSRPMRYY